MDYSSVFKALSDPTRLEIFEKILTSSSCGCNLLEGLAISQPTLSYHVKILLDANLITSRKEKTKIYYEVNHETFQAVKHYLAHLGQDTILCETKEEPWDSLKST